MRSTEKILTGDEVRWGELSPVVGGRHSRDPRWTVEEGANDGET
jgi:hypothetical protein